MKSFLILLLGFCLPAVSFASTSMAMIDIESSQFRDFTCFADSFAEITLDSATQIASTAETETFNFAGTIKAAEKAAPKWKVASVDFQFVIVVSKNPALSHELESQVNLVNPYVLRQEILSQNTLSYLELHIQTNRTHKKGGTGFLHVAQKNYGFGVQCFFGG